jgi:streptogramin lyase
MRVLAWLGLWTLVALAGCSGECRDADGDGRGEGCEAGPDCDDDDAALGEDCSAGARECADDPFAEGCACLAGSRRECYGGAESTRDVGMCSAGRQVCPTGRWSACDGEVLPQVETCDGEDDDCDGLADEGALSPCGGCNPDCFGGVWGPPITPFEAEGELALTDLGELTLRQYALESLTIWVPNTGEGTLSKVDAVSARETARYRLAGEAPEHVAVDHNGDAWVLSPGFTSESFLTRVAVERSRCRDRDGDGLATSGAPDDVLALGADECVMLSVPIAEAGEVARALAVDGRRAPDDEIGGDVWVGLQRAGLLLELDGGSGELVSSIELPGIEPHAAVFDPWGTLWVIDRRGLLARVLFGRDAIVEVIEAPLRCYELESIASDADGVLTLTGFACEDVIVYDPRRELWQHEKTPGVLDTRGVAVLGEHSWIVHSAGRISRVQRDPLALDATFALATEQASPFESIAIGADSMGQLWIVSSMGGPAGNGVLSRFDPEAENVTAQVPLGRLPRAQGDITGDRRISVFAPEASAAHVFDGCGVQRAPSGGAPGGQPTDWRRLHVGWSGAEGASVLIDARHAAERDALDGAEWLALGTLPEQEPPFALPFPTGGVVEVRLTLRVAGRLGAPRVARIGMEWACGGPD